MALHPKASGEDPIRGDGTIRVTDLGSDHRLVRDGVEQLAHGALVCPGCAMPVVIDQPVPVGGRLSCGFCGVKKRAGEFLVRDVYDTAGNEALLVARIAHPERSQRI